MLQDRKVFHLFLMVHEAVKIKESWCKFVVFVFSCIVDATAAWRLILVE